MPVEITFLRTDDIPVLTAEGAIDLGITGADLVAESGADVVNRLDLGVGSCRLALCVPDDATVDGPGALAGRRIATSFPRITRSWLADTPSRFSTTSAPRASRAMADNTKPAASVERLGFTMSSGSSAGR
jgi:ATP phosphoribosyltransferase